MAAFDARIWLATSLLTEECVEPVAAGGVSVSTPKSDVAAMDTNRRKQTFIRSAPMGRKRCILHGGTNPGAPEGNRNSSKHGGRSAESEAAARYLRQFARLVIGNPN